MKTFKEFWNNMDEAFNNPVDIKWIDKGSELGGFFVVNDKTYYIRCINKGENIWTYKFYVYSEEQKKLTPELIGDRINVFRVLPTVRNGFDYLIKLKDPEALIFGALDKSEGRKKLYNSFSLEIKDMYNFEYTTRQSGDKQVFILYKSSLDKELLFKKIIDISEETLDI